MKLSVIGDLSKSKKKKKVKKKKKSGAKSINRKTTQKNEKRKIAIAAVKKKIETSMLIKNTCVNCKGPKIKPSQAKSCTGIDTNQLIYVANQLTGFYTYLIRE